jgi:CubicO group peptidase (beta-lactamase class C family)
MLVRLQVALIVFVTSCLVTVAALAREPCGIPEIATGDWRIETQVNSGIDPERLCDLVAQLGAPNANIHSVLIARGGALVFEHYRSGPDERWGRPLGETAHGPNIKHDVRSVSKSVVSLLTGIALERKLIADIDRPVFAFFPEYAAARSPAKDRILLHHLLTMSSGFAWDENRPYTDPKNSEVLMNMMPEPYRYVLDQPLANEPGSKWNYSGGDVALLGAIIQKASGKRLADFARETLFDRLGITDFEWLDMRSGEVAAASGLRLRPRDMAKLGQLALDRGIWKGKQIVPAQWLTDSVRPRFATETVHYGYLWWVASSTIGSRKIDWFEAYGLGGQRIIVIPALDLVVIFTTGRYNIVDGWKVTEDLLNNFILPAIRPH